MSVPSVKTINYDPDITVVIPTLGEQTLSRTLKSIFEGSVVPHRILLCIPDEFAKRVKHLSETYNRVEVISTTQKGQVIQRILGFRECISKYTLQLDSDVILDKHLVENLKKSISEGSDTCVGPVIFSNVTKKVYSFLSSECTVYKNFQKKVIIWILNSLEGYQSGLISRGGVGFGYDETSNVSNTEWLPGCCIMHESKNLILENFYFWDGKAYSEDLYHSYYLKKNGVKLIFDKNSKLYVEFPEKNLNDIPFILKEQWKSFNMTLGFIKLTNKSLLRFFLFKLLNAVFLFSNKIFR
ncbi:glycosyltransferase [Paracoccaceae bacterium]|nr:glycosyltransferase [Paracoccaceae bacterium]